MSLSECFDLFAKSEELEDYKCDRCEEVGKARMKMQLTRVPDILIVSDSCVDPPETV